METRKDVKVVQARPKKRSAVKAKLQIVKLEERIPPKLAINCNETPRHPKTVACRDNFRRLRREMGWERGRNHAAAAPFTKE
jgi:hypothetical protein